MGRAAGGPPKARMRKGKSRPLRPEFGQRRNGVAVPVGRAGPIVVVTQRLPRLPVDEDVVRCNVDLALGVTKSDHLRVDGGLDGPFPYRGQEVELAGADLVRTGDW